MMRALICILLAGCVAGCATTPAPRQQVVEVKVKVKEPCIDKAPKRPEYQTGKGAYPGDATAAAMLASDFEKAEQYGTQWEAAAAGCMVIKLNAVP